MKQFDRYMLSQLMMLFGFFSLILVLIYWINRAVVLFDQLIADGQSAWVFLEFTALSLPSVIRLALPLAAFASAIYVTNRMTTESELVAVQATGFSPFRLARPVLYFGLIVGLLMSVFMHFLVPISSARLDDRENEIAQNITARLLTAGQFMEPVDNITFYVREITQENELLDVLLSDLRDPEEEVTYIAARAYLIRTQGRAQMVMRDGMIQSLQLADNRLFTTVFDDFVYDIDTLNQEAVSDRRSASEVSTWELLHPTAALRAETRRSNARLLARAHDRFGQSFLGVIGALLGFATLLVGTYSRFGVWRQIVAAILLIVVIKAVETWGVDLARGDETLWFAVYFSTATGFAIIWFLLFWASRPTLFKRQPITQATQ